MQSIVYIYHSIYMLAVPCIHRCCTCKTCKIDLTVYESKRRWVSRSKVPVFLHILLHYLWIVYKPLLRGFPSKQQLVSILHFENQLAENWNSRWLIHYTELFMTRLFLHRGYIIMSHGNAVADREHFVNASCWCVKGCPDTILIIYKLFLVIF